MIFLRRHARILFVNLGIVLLFLLMVYRAWLLAGDPYHLKTKQSNLMQKNITQPAPRGNIVDRYGYPLAMNVPLYRAYWDTYQVPSHSAEDRARLLDFFGHSPRLVRRLEHPSGYTFLGSINYAQKNILLKLRIPGIAFETFWGRYYSLGEALAPLLGKVSHDGHGQEGLERFYESHLMGEDGLEKIKRDRLGHVVDSVELRRRMREGRTLHLTIDHRLQQFVYRELLLQIKASHAKAGAVVVLNEHGDIMAMVSAPSYDPNEPIQVLDERIRNRALDVFEPGSTVKPLAFVGLLPKLPEHMVVNTEGGRYALGKFLIKDVRNYGSLSLEDVMAKSSNVAMIKLAKQVGGSVLIDVYRAFSLFEPSYAGLPGEHADMRVARVVPGSIPYYALSYGYGLQTNILQLAHAYLILARRGVDPGVHVLMKEHLGRPKEQQVFPAKAIDRVIKMMNKGIEDGTGSAAKVEGVMVAGKTGTTQLLAPSGRYDAHRHIASFVGFAPSDQNGGKSYTIAVAIFEPEWGKHFGGQAAAPLFAKTMSYVLSLSSRQDEQVSWNDFGEHQS